MKTQEELKIESRKMNYENNYLHTYIWEQGFFGGMLVSASVILLGFLSLFVIFS